MSSTPRELVPLMEAVSAKDDQKWWPLYLKASDKRAFKYMTRQHFQMIIGALHPRIFIPNMEYQETVTGYQRRLFYRRLEMVKLDVKRRKFELGQWEWNHILDCARALNDINQARKWWGEMRYAGVTPSTWCYNTFMATLCGTAAKLARLTDPDSPLFSKPGKGRRLVSSIARRLIREMEKKNVFTSCQTYEILLTAYARDKLYDKCDQVVKKVWGFNPDGTRTQLATPTKSSPLFPSDHTFIAIANSYGYAGSLSTAVKLLGKMSVYYRIRIPVAAWLGLLVWTVRRSRPPSKGELSQGELSQADLSQAELSPETPMEIFRVMTSPPFDISPGLEAYWLMIKHELNRDTKESRNNVETLLLDVLKRYGPNGTDLSQHTFLFSTTTLRHVKVFLQQWLQTVQQHHDKDTFARIFSEWQIRLLHLGVKGLLPPQDEADAARKTDIGIIMPPKVDPLSFARKERAPAVITWPQLKDQADEDLFTIPEVATPEIPEIPEIPETPETVSPETQPTEQIDENLVKEVETPETLGAIMEAQRKKKQILHKLARVRKVKELVRRSRLGAIMEAQRRKAQWRKQIRQKLASVREVKEWERPSRPGAIMEAQRRKKQILHKLTRVREVKEVVRIPRLGAIMEAQRRKQIHQNLGRVRDVKELVRPPRLGAIMEGQRRKQMHQNLSRVREVKELARPLRLGAIMEAQRRKSQRTKSIRQHLARVREVKESKTSSITALPATLREVTESKRSSITALPTKPREVEESKRSSITELPARLFDSRFRRRLYPEEKVETVPHDSSVRDPGRPFQTN